MSKGKNNKEKTKLLGKEFTDITTVPTDAKDEDHTLAFATNPMFGPGDTLVPPKAAAMLGLAPKDPDST